MKRREQQLPPLPLRRFPPLRVMTTHQIADLIRRRLDGLPERDRKRLATVARRLDGATKRDEKIKALEDVVSAAENDEAIRGLAAKAALHIERRTEG